MSKLSKWIKALAVATVFAAPIASMATPIIGTVNLTVGQVKLVPGYIDWNNDGTTSVVTPLPTCPGCNLNPQPTGGATTDGQFNVAATINGSFLTDLVQPGGRIRDMADPTFFPLALGNAFPLATLTSVADFLKFDGKTTWSFTATYLYQGNIVGSPFSVVSSGNGSTVSMTIIGTACDMATSGLSSICDATDDKTNWTLTLSSNYNDTAAALQTKLFSGTLQNNAWSGVLVASPLPEPASLALVGLALAGAGAVARRRRAK